MPHLKNIKSNCVVCGKEFLTSQYAISKGRKCCSLSCASKCIKRIPLQDRFWGKVIKRGSHECWEFTGALNENGYGQFAYNGKSMGAHRIAYMLSIGEQKKGFVIMHICDNRKCCNPNHLLQGLQRDNVLDMVNKKRNAPCSGEKAGRSKLSHNLVKEIREKYKGNFGDMSRLAKEYGVVVQTISNVIHFNNWK